MSPHTVKMHNILKAYKKKDWWEVVKKELSGTAVGMLTDSVLMEMGFP